MERKEIIVKRAFAPTPVVNLTKIVGASLIAKLVKGPKEYKAMGRGSKFIYDIEVIDGNMTFSVKDGESYKDVDVDQGQKVGLFATGPLNEKLKTISLGSEIAITYVGKVKMKTGNFFHDFKVFC